MTTYYFMTAHDEKTRGNPRGKYPRAISHWALDGMLCAWNNNSVCSDDLGVTWKQRPSSWIHLAPGMDIQCRCTSAPSWNNFLNSMDKELT